MMVSSTICILRLIYIMIIKVWAEKSGYLTHQYHLEDAPSKLICEKVLNTSVPRWFGDLLHYVTLIVFRWRLFRISGTCHYIICDKAHSDSETPRPLLNVEIAFLEGALMRLLCIQLSDCSQNFSVTEQNKFILCGAEVITARLCARQ